MLRGQVNEQRLVSEGVPWLVHCGSVRGVGERAYVEVPFAEKDEAKRLGARWDMAELRWYAPPGREAGLSRWAPAAPLPAVLPGENRAFGSGLFVDLIPASCWFTNVRSCVSARDWERLRTLVYGRAGNRCEACGAGVDREHQVWLEAHERWDYHHTSRTQRLRRLVCLCTRCHQATQFGYAEITGRAEAHVAAAASLWRLRSETDWALDLSILTGVGITPQAPRTPAQRRTQAATDLDLVPHPTIPTGVSEHAHSTQLDREVPDQRAGTRAPSHDTTARRRTHSVETERGRPGRVLRRWQDRREGGRGRGEENPSHP